MKILCYILPVLVLLLIGCTKNIPDDLAYIDQVKPSTTPLLFAKKIISNDTIAVFGSIFNKEKDEFYFAVDADKRAHIKYTKYQDGKWIKPMVILADSVYSFNDPFLSNDENRLYYISDLPRNEQDTIKDFDIWYSEKMGGKWSAPINAGDQINSDKNEYYISFTSTDKIYFASNIDASAKRKHDFDIFSAVYEHGEFQKPVKLSDSINSGRYEADVFIAPDESYIIYCTARKTGFGKGDLNISFKDENGNWTASINMGEKINSKHHELCPFVTKDGKYLFYTSNQNIYWVSTEILKELSGKSRQQ